MRFISQPPKLLQLALTLIGLALLAPRINAAEWQWSVPAGFGRAFLWIPPDCQQVRAVLIGQHNMIEETILEHPQMRATLAKLGIAEVWIIPPQDPVFDFNKGAGKRFEQTMNLLAAESGYGELAWAPAIPIGHSACASYPWNFAAWNPARTLAILSIHGDAPLTNMTGSGRPNPAWGDRNIDGIPGLMVMGEYEWFEDRLTPALAFRERFPHSPVAFLPEPGRGHFDVSEDLVNFLALFIRKAAEQRLPIDAPIDHAPILRPIDPAQGWLIERARLNTPRTVAAGPATHYAGAPKQSFWCFDKEMAHATETYRSNQIGKRPQLLTYVQDGKPVAQTNTHQQVNLRSLPLGDGITFRLGATFLESVEASSASLSRWSYLPVGAPLGHATGGGPITLSRITGPVAQTGPDTFVIRLNRAASTIDKRNNEIWLLASQPGDEQYKSAVQQALLRISPNTDGIEQHITFPEIPDQKNGTGTLKLNATSDAGVQIGYYVREGPAEIDGDTLCFTHLPPRSRFPVPVTIVAWQWGHSSAPKLRTAVPVERTFYITH